MFKRIYKPLIAFIFTCVLVTLPFVTNHVDASSATSYTMTLNSKGNYVRTQDAYLPDQTLADLQLVSPQDLFLVDTNDDGNDDFLYIADTGNKRIVKYNFILGEIAQEITYEEFKTPKGLFITDKNKDIYVADTDAGAVFRFDINGNFIEKFTRPTSPSFGDIPFNPNKVAVDNRGNLYIYGDAVTDGIIQLSNSGEFLGYFTSNKVQLTVFDVILDMFSTETQKEQRHKNRIPKTFSNVFIDNEGIVYTTTTGSILPGLKKHNTQGGNIFDSQPIITYEDPTDVYVDKNGIIYVSMENGTIFVYSQHGEFIYNFGANNQSQGTGSEDISGLYSSLSSIAIDSYGRIWTLDNKKAFVQSFKPTEYANMIYEALDLFQRGKYDESVAIWEEVIRLNQMSVLAHNNIGKNYQTKEQYEQAMYHFQLAGNRFDYSESYWEVRNTWLQNYLAVFLVLIVALVVLYKIFKTQILSGIHFVATQVKKVKIITDVLYMFRVLKRPIDSFYELKKSRKGSLLGAIIIYVLFFICFMWFTVGKGFVFQFVAVEDLDINSIVLGFFALTLLFVLCNYLVTSINDGEGGLKQIFIMFCYSLAPIMIATIVITTLSYVLTFNEVFFISFTLSVGYFWTGLNIFLGIGETHNYTILNTIKSIIITIGFMIVLAIVLIVIIMMWDQLYQFFESIIKEAIRNVTQ